MIPRSLCLACMGFVVLIPVCCAIQQRDSTLNVLIHIFPTG